MKKNLPIKKKVLLRTVVFCMSAMLSFQVNAQIEGVVLFDMETTETTCEGDFSFGNGHFGSDTFGIVTNPLVEGINTSDNVWQWCKSNDGATWGGVVYNNSFDFTGTAFTICMDVLMPHDGDVLLKMENAVNDLGEEFDVSLVMPYTGNGAWQQICFEYTTPDNDGDVGNGYVFPAFTVFMDFGNTPAEDECHYFDNIIQVEGPVVPLTGTVLYDWEVLDSTVLGEFSFGNGHFGDSIFSIALNPLMEGINASDSVYLWCKANDGNTWGGINYTAVDTIDMTGLGTTLCLDVLMPHDGDVLLKLENSLDDDEVDVSLVMPYTGNGEWQQLCYDFRVPDNDGDVAAGRMFPSFTIFMDFGNTPAEDECHYYDNLIQVEVPLEFDGEVIADWETPETTPDPFAFGGATIAVANNPNADAANSSDSTYLMCKDENSETWGGFAFTMKDTLDVTGDTSTVCLSVYSEVENTVRLKLEGATDGSEPVSFDAQYTTPGAWQVLCYDLTEEGATGLALGHLYTKMSLFPDFGTVPGASTCYYVDDIKKSTNGTGVLLQLIYNVLAASPDHSMLTGLIDAADLSNAVNADGATVFAPTDDALNALPAADLDALNNNIDGALYNMLFHHITHDSLPSDLLVDGTHIMRNGQDGIISGTAINGANIASSTEAVNGYVHSVESVMTFPEDPEEYILLEFEGEDEYEVDWWHWGTAGNIVSFEIVANPLVGGINESANVLQYKRYPAGDWWQGIKSIPKRVFNSFGPMTRVCADIYSENDGTIFLKWDATMGTGDKIGWRSSFSGGEWNTICWDFEGSNWYFEQGEDVPATGENHLNEGMALFFDTENSSLPADTVVYYLDNWRIINTATGTNNIEKLENFRLYPNPATNWLAVESGTPIHSANMFDITGRQLFSVVDPIANKLDVSQLKSGLYFVNFRGKSGELLGSVKFVKQ